MMNENEFVSGSDRSIRVSSVLERSVAHGPGERFVIWVQGCHLSCPGCFSPWTHDFDTGRLLPVCELMAAINQQQDLEGITITGGEPMLQAKALVKVANAVRTQGGSVMCYTGYTLEELTTSNLPEVTNLLQLTDILVDGRYQPHEQANLRWRGSRNQRVHYLTDRYRHLDVVTDVNRTHVELVVDQQGFTTTGIWPRGFVERVKGKVQ